ncbi:MAG: DUF4374 domain-containing protein [Paludibacteraceae bacterium]|nr:DUF4374 domain-containing protein [Paludibacteraceae bacterium]
MKFKYLFFAVAFASIFTSCEDDEDDNTSSASGKIIFSTTVTNPSGDSGSGYLQAISDFSGGVNYDNKNAIPLGFGSYPCVCKSGNIYVFPDYMGGTELKLKRYVLNNSDQLELQGAMPLPANSSAANVVEASEEKAYVCCQSLDLIIAFNPKTMKEISRIDVSSLRNEGVSAYPGAMYIRDNILYVALEQYNSQWMPTENAIEMALYKVSDDSFIKRIRNTSLGICGPTRPIDNQSIFEDENGDIYINCVGSFGYIPGLDAGIARIKKGETDFDPSYTFNLTNTKVEGLPCDYLNILAKCQYTSNGILYAYGYAIGLDPENTNTYTARTGAPVVVDLRNKTVKVIEGLPRSNGHGIAMGIHEGKIVYGSANDAYNGFSTYDPKSGTIETKVITVTGFPSFFHSFK